MRIAFVSPHDFQGGASRIGYYLFSGFRNLGHETAFFVGKRSLADDDVHQIRKFDTKAQKYFGKVKKRIDLELGHEHFYYPNSAKQILAWKPDIIHFHNPQGGYFELPALKEMSKQVPVLFTLHDPWMFTGHCSYFIECERWLKGCGNCPDLNRRPSLKRDGTAFNWQRKRKLYQNSNFYVATPSAWLLKEAERSILKEAIIEGRVINNGVNQAVFKPKDTADLRSKLGIPQEEMVLLYVVNSHMRTNPYKDFTTISKALEHLNAIKRKDQKFTFVALGTDGDEVIQDGIRMLYAGFQTDTEVIASYFNMADLYLHAARAENYPNVVMEALACGTPCVVTNTGGVPEQIIQGKTGWIVPFEGAKEMAETIFELSQKTALLDSASKEARNWIEQNHSLSHMIKEYSEFYQKIITNQRNQ
jgi:glycosyltransferase involved in cell wall biosynthesis